MNMKISKNWDCIKSFDELVLDARFVFTHEKSNPRIVIKTPIDGYDCIEIETDRYGLINGGVSKFNEQWGDLIIDSSQEIVEFIYLSLTPLPKNSQKKL